MCNSAHRKTTMIELLSARFGSECSLSCPALTRLSAGAKRVILSEYEKLLRTKKKTSENVKKYIPSQTIKLPVQCHFNVSGSIHFQKHTPTKPPLERNEPNGSTKINESSQRGGDDSCQMRNYYRAGRRALLKTKRKIGVDSKKKKKKKHTHTILFIQTLF